MPAKSVTELSSELIASYARVGGINNLDGKNLPSKGAIVQISHDLLRLLFPGYYEDRSIHSWEVRIVTATLMDSIQGRLEDEICKGLEYEGAAEGGAVELRPVAHEISMEFLADLPRVREVLKTDAEAAYDGDPAATSEEEIILAYPFMEAIAIQRMAHILYQLKVPILPRIMTEWAHSRTGMDLHPGARIGSHFFIDHGTGTVVGETCIIGSQVKIYHGVTLGARSTSGGQQLRGVKRHPTIEDEVTVYPGATILGGDTVIGAGSTIGGNAFLMESVPPNSLVLPEEVKVKVMNKGDRRNDPDAEE